MDAANTGMTLWLPLAVYIPKTTEGAKLDAAKKFLAFIASPEGCEVQAKAYAPTGPYMLKGCELPDDVPAAVKDLQPYVDDGNVTPALEFLSPVKGPALEQITVEVGLRAAVGRGRRQALRRGRQEAGAAAGARGLVST